MGMIERISEAEAVRDFPAVLERVRSAGVSIEIVRGEEVVARLLPPPAEEPKPKTLDELFVRLRELPPLSSEESAAWEKDLADIRKEFPMQEREWD